MVTKIFDRISPKKLEKVEKVEDSDANSEEENLKTHKLCNSKQKS